METSTFVFLQILKYKYSSHVQVARIKWEMSRDWAEERKWPQTTEEGSEVKQILSCHIVPSWFKISSQVKNFLELLTVFPKPEHEQNFVQPCKGAGLKMPEN